MTATACSCTRTARTPPPPHGIDFTERFPSIAYALARLPARRVIIDAEVVAVTARGLPNFFALHLRRAKPEDICCYAFDLLQHNKVDTRPLQLLTRRARLRQILERFDDTCIRFSEAFSDPEALLAACERHGLEGVVSKRKDAPYPSGKCDWIKVKTRAWREANKRRGELFNPR